MIDDMPLCDCEWCLSFRPYPEPRCRPLRSVRIRERRARRRRWLQDAAYMPLWCLDATLGGMSPSVALTAACGVYLGVLFEMPLWLVCAILFVASVLPAPPDHTSQQ